MAFSSVVFLCVFLPVVCILNWLMPGIRCKNALLVVASLIFYAFGNPFYLLLLVGSVLCNYLAGLLVTHPRWGRLFLALAVAVNLGALAFYKYLGFLVQNLNLLLGTALPVPAIVLPVGISFFTFQGLSYVIDVYRDRTLQNRSFFEVLLYICLFPQLVAGPIVKYRDIAAEIHTRRATLTDTAQGVRRFILGLSKKLLLADTAAGIADTVFGLEAGSLDIRLAWLGAVAYTLQIYFDFSGYSDMAVGLGWIFGFHFKENFDHPYSAGSIKQFWRRWHITLSGWFRDYIYIPMGGNRKGTKRLIFNLAFVWLLTGIWHGNGLNFILWGLVLGGLIILEKLTYGKWLKNTKVLSHIYVILLLPLTWMIFAITDLGELGVYFARLFPFFGIGETLNAGDIGKYLSMYWPYLLAGVLCCVPVLSRIYEKWKRKWFVTVLLVVLFWAAVYRLSVSAGNRRTAGFCAGDDFADVLFHAGNLVSSDLFHLLCADAGGNGHE